jgi:putative endonuclease
MKNVGPTLQKTSCFLRGLSAEKTAEQFLKDHGYALLTHRYKTKFGELDLVMHQENHLVFVEVKQRPHITAGLLSITSKQQKRLWNAGEYFLQNYEPQHLWTTIRFDLIIVLPDLHITHISNILTRESEF